MVLPLTGKKLFTGKNVYSQNNSLRRDGVESFHSTRDMRIPLPPAHHSFNEGVACPP
jgi:hypothetical protein